MCWENDTKAHVYIHDIIQPIPETFRAQGMLVGKRAPQTSHCSFTVYVLLPPLLKNLTYCPMLKALTPPVL